MRHLSLASVLVLIAICGNAVLVSAQSTRSTAQIPLSEIHERQILVELNSTRGAKAVSAFCTAKGVSFVSSLPLSYATYQIVRVPDGADYAATLAALQSDPSVKAAGPNVIKHASYVPNDPLLFNGAADETAALQDPWVKNDQWGLLLCGATEAWNTTTGVSGIVVAHLDTGVNMAQEDLLNRLWTNSGEIPGNSIDDDSNGRIDDIHGWDFEGVDSGGLGGDADPSDPSGAFVSHGTATASIIAAQGGNGVGIAGVAGGHSGSSGARLMICRVGTDSNITVAAEIAAIDYAIDNGAKIISMSFGGYDGGAPEEDAINRAWNSGVLPIAAGGNAGAGNGDLIDLPAGFQNCMAVAATTIFDSQTVNSSTPIIAETRGSYSKTGPELDIAAPGTHILAAANASNVYTDSAAGSHQFTGTSAATPIVAGLAALILSHEPTLSALALRQRIQDTALDLGAAGVDNDFGYGRINMALALNPLGKPGDTNGDSLVSDADVNPISQNFGAKTGDATYQARIDCNGDGVIDELDLFVVGREFGT